MNGKLFNARHLVLSSEGAAPGKCAIQQEKFANMTLFPQQDYGYSL